MTILNTRMKLENCVYIIDPKLQSSSDVKISPNIYSKPATMLGISFLVIFSGFSTLENLQKTLLASVQYEKPEFTGDGYTSLSILYSVFAISIWFSPSIISITGPVMAMVIGATAYVLFPITFILESTFFLYFGAFMNGIGSSLLWTGQANYLILNSKPGIVSKNVGLFWIFYMMGMLPGNLFAYFAFKDKRKHIDKWTRVFILTVLSIMMGIGVIIMYFLRRPRIRNQIVEQHQGEILIIKSSPGRAFKNAIRLCASQQMLWLMLPFCYAGLHLTFFSSVYSASVGFTLKMGESTKQLVPLAGFLTGIGEITGGMLPFLLNNRKCCGLSLIMLTGILSNLFSYGVTYINIPNVAPFGNTWDSAIIPPNEHLAILCSFLMGLGDCCVHTEIYSILGTIYPGESAEVFAVFKFVRCLCTAADFYCSSIIGLHTQLFIQTLFAILCLLCYIVIQIKYMKPTSTGHVKNSAIRRSNLKTLCVNSSAKHIREPVRLNRTPIIRNLTQSNHTDESASAQDSVNQDLLTRGNHIDESASAQASVNQDLLTRSNHIDESASTQTTFSVDQLAQYRHIEKLEGAQASAFQDVLTQSNNIDICASVLNTPFVDHLAQEYHIDESESAQATPFVAHLVQINDTEKSVSNRAMPFMSVLTGEGPEHQT